MEELENDIDGLGGYLRFDERTDVLASLSVCLMCLRNVGGEFSLWKWAILSLHNALQGAMVCHLSGTANIGALSYKSATEYLEWFKGERKDNPPKERLAYPNMLFKRLSNENKRYEGGAGAVLKITDSQKDSFRRLHNFRNDFSHFTPKLWSVELTGLPGIFMNMIEVIEIISNDEWPFRHMNDNDKLRLRNLLKLLKAEIRNLN